MERWLPIVGYEGYYEVSSLGRVRSLDRTITYVNGRVDHRFGSLMSTRARPDGYLQVNLCRDSKKAVLLVHHLACEAFHGPRPTGLDVAHNSGVRSDNSETNLRYDTRKGNLADTAPHNTRPTGERHGAAKLTKSDVLAIRQATEPHAILATRYGVHPNHISRVKRGERWGALAMAA